MAKRKLKPDAVNRYLSFIDPDNTGFSIDLDDEPNTLPQDQSTAQGGINNLAKSLAERDKVSNIAGMAGTSSTLPDANVTEKARRPLNITLPSGGMAARYNPLLTGNADLSRIAQSTITDLAGGLTTPDARNVTEQGERLPTARETALSISPEEKFAAVLANTNPTPQSFWKRLLAGALQGMGRVTPQDTGGSAFGKIVGNVVGRAFPGVDSAQLYDERVARAREKYGTEAAIAKQKLERRKIEADITDKETQRRISLVTREEQRREKMLLDAARLRDDKRAEAQLRLNALKELASDSPKRDEIAEELQQSYGVNVDRSYGLNTKPATEKEISEDQIRKRATSEVMAEIGATVEKIARDSTDNKPHIIKARADLDSVLNNPKSTDMSKASARERFEKAYALELKVNLDHTNSDVENKIRQREQELRGEGPSPTRQSRGKRTTRPSRGASVAPSPAAQSTNFAQPGRIIKKR